MHFTNKDLYKLLRISRTATQREIKQSYLQIALTLHPDRHSPGGKGVKNATDSSSSNNNNNNNNNNNDIKTEEFKKVSEAYGILRDRSLRTQYDKWLDSVESGGTGSHAHTSRAAARNPFYRKVYSPAAPPGMKTFDPQRHYDMHYGDGMMNEAIERARKRAQAASSRHPGLFASHNHHHHNQRHSSYQSPLGAGFTFDRNRPKSEQINPYSIKGKRQRQQKQSRNDENDGSNDSTSNDDDDDGDHGNFRILYEESHFNMNGGQWSSPRDSTNGGGGLGRSGGFSSSMERMQGGKEYVVERMKNRRKYRVRERGEPNPYYSHHRRHPHVDVNYNNGEGAGKNDKNSSVASGCVIM